MDVAVVPLVRRERRAAPTCARLQSRDFLRTLATPEPIKDWSLMSLKEKVIKIGAKVLNHQRYGHPSDGRGRHPTANVPGGFAVDRGAAAATATTASMKRSIVTRSSAANGRNASRCQ